MLTDLARQGVVRILMGKASRSEHSDTRSEEIELAVAAHDLEENAGRSH